MSVLDKTFDVACADSRGLGQSGFPTAQYQMSDLAADASQFADHLGWDRFSVMGVSFGGMVAQELAVTSPERIERLALVCTSPGGEFSAYPLQDLAGLDPDERASVFPTIVDTRFTSEWIAQHRDAQVLLERLVATQTAVKSERVLEGEAMQMKARAGHDVLDRLHRATCPTLVASGRFDGISPPVNGEAIATRIPGAEFRVFEGGHAFFMQDPTAIGAIVGFLEHP